MNFIVEMTKIKNLLKVGNVLLSTMFGEQTGSKKNGSSNMIKYFDCHLTVNTNAVIADCEFISGQGFESKNMNSPNKYLDMHTSNEIKIYPSIAL